MVDDGGCMLQWMSPVIVDQLDSPIDQCGGIYEQDYTISQ